MRTIKQHATEQHGGSQRAMAKACETTEQLVSAWSAKGFIVTTEGWVINPQTTKRDLSIETPITE